MALKHPTNANDSEIQLSALFSSSQSAHRRSFQWQAIMSSPLTPPQLFWFAAMTTKRHSWCDSHELQETRWAVFPALLRHSVTHNQSEAFPGEALDWLNRVERSDWVTEINYGINHDDVARNFRSGQGHGTFLNLFSLDLKAELHAESRKRICEIFYRQRWNFNKAIKVRLLPLVLLGSIIARRVREAKTGE